MHKFLDALEKLMSEAKSTMQENETRIFLLTQPNGNIQTASNLIDYAMDWDIPYCKMELAPENSKNQVFPENIPFSY